MLSLWISAKMRWMIVLFVACIMVSASWGAACAPDPVSCRDYDQDPLTGVIYLVREYYGCPGACTCTGGWYTATKCKACGFAGNCMEDLDEIYNDVCPGYFDWANAGDLNTVTLPDHSGDFITNLDCIDDRLGTLTDANMDKFQQAYADHLGFPTLGIDIKDCVGSMMCSLKGGELKIDNAGDAVMFSFAAMNDALNMNVKGETGPPPQIRFTGTSPAAKISYSDGTEVRSIGDNSYFSNNWTASGVSGLVTVAPGNGPVTVSMDPLYASDGAVLTDSSLSIRNADVIASYGDQETVGITTNNLTGTVSLQESPLHDYDIDLTGAGDSVVTVMSGLQGIAYDDGDMSACNPLVGSCPYDPGNLTVDVKWRDGAKEYSLQMIGQDRIIGEAFSTCSCDENPECDAGCSCDLTCPLVNTDDWVYIMLGYKEYLRFMQDGNGTGTCSDDSDCLSSYGGSLGRGYHLYEDGNIVDDRYRLGSSAILYHLNGTIIRDDCGTLRAFSGTLQHCSGGGNDAGSICQRDCSSINYTERSCDNCLRRCDHAGNAGGKIMCSLQAYGMTKEYKLDEAAYTPDPDDPNKQFECNHNSTYLIDHHCEKHCGYCNSYPHLSVDEIELANGDTLSVNLTDIFEDEYPESTAYSLISQTGGLGCSIINGPNEACFSYNTTGTYTRRVLNCGPVASSGVVEIRAVDECGLENKDDVSGSYQNLTVTVV